MKQYKTILIDPPWDMKMTGLYQLRKLTPARLVYPTMSLQEIAALPINELSEVGCHLWLWTTNQFLPCGFDLMKAWGFKYHAPIHWKKPGGCGNYFVHVTQTLLFGYKERCIFNRERYKPNWIETGLPKKHSQKPIESYELIESISEEPRLEMFARAKRAGWDCWGNEVECDINIDTAVLVEGK
jgi:N6-adenosine-specific RNA methylase IME4